MSPLSPCGLYITECRKLEFNEDGMVCGGIMVISTFMKVCHLA